MIPLITVAEAQQEVRNRARLLTQAEIALEDTPGCDVRVHPQPVDGCARCDAWRLAHAHVKTAERLFDNAVARLAAVDSQQRRRVA